MRVFNPDQDNYDSSVRHFGEDRFPEGCWGREEWRKTIFELDALAKSGEALSLPSEDPTPRLRRPRVFISHKQQDAAKARRIAWLATRNGFSFWLDVLDPTITWLSESRIDRRKRSLLIARTIEVALLNATHVIALITPRSVESRWIPYEYGRVKERSVTSELAACWVAPRQSRLLTEYMYLGHRLATEDDIAKWLRQQKRWFLRNNRLPSLPRRTKRAWTGPAPKALPGAAG